MDDTRVRRPRPGRRWYLVYSKPRQEEVASRNLRRQEFETYLPRVRTMRRRGGKRSPSVEALFPRYLFVMLDPVQDNWAPIRSTIGVTSLVRFGAEPAEVPESLVSFLKEREDESGLQVVELGRLSPGQSVRVEEGPLAGYEGIFLARTGRDRVVVLLDILGRNARLELEEDALGPANP